jgi:tRNA threonylcarbamoyladenosine biosynthesis protein TsaE
MRVRTRSADATRSLAATIAAHLVPGDVVVLAGDLGSGKTTFAQGIAAGLGVTEPVTSPTFTIVQEYAGRVPVAHVDVYRLDRFQELHDLGLEEMYDARVTLVEWGDVVDPALPTDRMSIRLEPGDGDDERVVEIVTHGPSWRGRTSELDAALANVSESR